MIRSPIHLSIFILIALFLAACGSRQTPLPSVIVLTDAPTRTAFPTITATPSPGLFTAIHSQVTYVPTRTPTLTKTLAPTRTRTSIPTITSTFAPTLPPATIAAGPEGYRLREWTEQEALNAIAEGEHKLTEWKWSDGPYIYSYADFAEYLIDIKSEALTQFPTTADTANLLWRLAYLQADFFLHPPLPIHYLLLALEGKLNSGETTLDTLDQWLSQQGIIVTADYTPTNLLGDGQRVHLIHINRDYNRSAILIAIGSQSNGYHLLSLNETWVNTWHAGEQISANDLNGNGQPEIQLITDYFASGQPGACGSHIAIYEWQGQYPNGRFVNLAENIRDIFMSSDDGDCERPWEFVEETDGTQSIVAVKRLYTDYSTDFLDCPLFEHRTVYSWVDSAFRLAYEPTDSFDVSSSLKCAVTWVDRAGGLNEQAVDLLTEAMAEWPDEVNSLWGPAAQDYFRFKLGTWYALRGQTELAENTLQLVRDQTVAPQFTLASRMADAYLAWYEKGQNSAGGCRAALQTLNVARPEFSQDSFGAERNLLLQAWGFAAPDWRYYAYDVCDPNVAFQQSDLTFIPTNTAELIQWFRERRFPIWAVEQGDLDNDGTADWLVLAKINDSRAWDVWALIRNQDHLKPVFVECCHATPNTFFTTLSQVQGDPALVNIFTVGESVTTFQILLTSGKLQSVLLPSPLQPKDTPTAPPTQSEQIAIVEQTLFEQGNVPEALKQLQNMWVSGIVETPLWYPYDGEPPRVKPRLLYLLGLAHELSGHEREAVQAYWQLWHDYADSPYTLMARRKLEVVGP